MNSFRYAPLSVLTLIGLALLASLEVGAPVQARGGADDGFLSVSRTAELASAVVLRRVLERLACGSADGQLSDGQGTGTWDFPERACSGQWVARRSS